MVFINTAAIAPFHRFDTFIYSINSIAKRINTVEIYKSDDTKGNILIAITVKALQFQQNTH